MAPIATKARILHVDDHQDTRLLMSALLTDCGYAVITAGSVTEALKLASEVPVDLYLLDIVLPDGSGIELCQKLRALHPRIPVIYYSAYGDNAAVREALDTCGDSYLRKPLSIAEIEREIERVLRDARHS